MDTIKRRKSAPLMSTEDYSLMRYAGISGGDVYAVVGASGEAQFTLKLWGFDCSTTSVNKAVGLFTDVVS